MPLRISGAFRSEQDVLNTNFAVGSRMLRLSDIAKVRRSFADPPQPIFRINGEPGHRDLPSPCAMAESILALGKNIERAISQLTIDLPVGTGPQLVADQSATVKSAIAEFMTSLWQAIAIILVVSFVSLGIRPGLVIALAIPLTLTIVFAVMQGVNIDMQRISLGALIIALALLVDDAMTTTDAMLSRLARGDDKVEAGTFAFRTYAFAMLAGTLVTIAGFVPVGFAASSAGEYTFSLFAVVGIALIVSWFVAVIFAPVLGVVLTQTARDRPGRSSRQNGAMVPKLSSPRYAGAMADDFLDPGAVDCSGSGAAARASAILSVIGSPRAAGRSQFAAKCLDVCQRELGAPFRCQHWSLMQTSSAGAPTSAAAPSASICHSVCSCPMTFFRSGDRCQGCAGTRKVAQQVGEGIGR